MARPRDLRQPVVLKYDPSVPEQKEFLDWCQQNRKGLSALILDMWRGQVTEVVYMESKSVLNLENMIRDIMTKYSVNQTTSPVLEESADDDALEAMFDL